MKQYGYVKEVNVGNSMERFGEIVLQEVKVAQDAGYEVDVQYSTSDGQSSALILGYKTV